MRYPFFGVSPDHYATGDNPTIAINGDGKVAALHQYEGKLYWQAGEVKGTTLCWNGKGDKSFDQGFSPSVALRGDVVLEVHDSGGASSDCWYWTGRLKDGGIVWDKHEKYDGGREPSVAVNASGIVVEVHNREVGSPLFWRLGRLDGTDLTWMSSKGQEFAAGYHASVSVNASGLVVVTYDLDWKLCYRVGQVVENKINWEPEQKYDSGRNSSIVLTDDNYVFEVHQSQGVPPLVDGATVWQRNGRIVDRLIQWADIFGSDRHSRYYDDGETPQIASNGSRAVQVHRSENFSELHADACLVANRASWMEDNIGTLGDKSLSEVVIPASHDAAMYLGGFDFAVLGKTQDLNLYSQLVDGVRYFDLRPEFAHNEFFLYHGPVQGPPLSEVLAQIRDFFSQKHKELVVLKFSHFKNFNQEIFERLCTEIHAVIGDWFFDRKLEKRRLARIPLKRMIESAGAALVVYDSDEGRHYHPPQGMHGVYVYRDWYAADPAVADLTVFDIYSNTMSFDVMAYSEEPDKDHPAVPRGQLPKFKSFDGKCQNDPDVPCDLFLLSWTLTPPTAVWTVARIADKHLVDNMDTVEANDYDRIVNVLYVDYSEYARATDVAMVRNGLVD